MGKLIEYKCPCCGGSIEFDSKLQKMKCPYCDTEFDVDTLKDYDDVLKKQEPDSMEWEESSESWNGEEEDGVSVFVCQSCGGEILCDATTAATSCPYCSNPVVMTGRLSGDIKPDFIIPFKLDKEAAKNGFSKHLSNKKLLPKIFKSEAYIDEIKGVYVPFWLYDTDVDARMHYKGTKVRHWSDSKYDYTETSHFSIYREGEIAFDNVPADGSSKMDDVLMESIEPFDFSEAVDFKTAYLSGYLADRYDSDVKERESRANQRIRTSTESEFANTVIGYSSIVPVGSSVKFKNARSKYVLYPVWLMTATWRDKKYYFAMNGQTGKFVGDLPTDYGAYFKWLGGVTAIASAAAFGILCLINLF